MGIVYIPKGMSKEIYLPISVSDTGLGKFKLSPKGLFKLGLKLDPLRKYTEGMIRAMPGEPIVFDTLKEARQEVREEERQEEEARQPEPTPAISPTAELFDTFSQTPEEFFESDIMGLSSLKPYLPMILMGFVGLIVMSIVMKPKTPQSPAYTRKKK